MEPLEKAHEEIGKLLQNALKEIEKAKKLARESGIIIKAQLDYNVRIPAQHPAEWDSSRDCSFEYEKSPWIEEEEPEHDDPTDDDIPF